MRATVFVSTFLARSCSQIRSTRQPALLSSRFTFRSRCLFPVSFLAQNSSFCFGHVACFGHPCQKQPSTKTATRSRKKTKSGLPGSDRFRRHPEIPCALKMAISRSSVSLLPVPRIAAITAERLVGVNTSVLDSGALGMTVGRSSPSVKARNNLED
jgi:hypothetical protein